MSPMVIAYLPHLSVSQQQMVLVERKGLGHPDSMCDAIMEAISVALCRTSLDATEQVLPRATHSCFPSHTLTTVQCDMACHPHGERGAKGKPWNLPQHSAP